MSFIYNLLRNQAEPYDIGAIISDTDDLNHEPLQLSTLNRAPIIATTFKDLGALSLPQTITVRLHLKPRPLLHKTITAQLIYKGDPWKPCSIYDEHSVAGDNQAFFHKAQWSGIDFILEGNLYYDQKNHKKYLSPNNALFSLPGKKGDILYHYNFAVPNQEQYVYEKFLYQPHHWFNRLGSHTHCMDGDILFPYAGYCPANLDVNHICQTYGLIADAGMQRTMVMLYTQRDCDAEGIDFNSPNNPTNFYYCGDTDSLSTIRLTLGGWLLKGFLTIPIKCLQTDTTYFYQSINFDQSDPNTGLIDITFKQTA